jgi:hypothetical protein
VAYSPHARELRRCRATTRDGRPCRRYAAWDDALGRCGAHGGRVQGEHTREKTAYVPCRCMAYPFPHRPAGGLCEWPDAPRFRSTLRPGTHSGGTDARKGIRKWTNQPTMLFFRRLYPQTKEPD